MSSSTLRPEAASYGPSAYYSYPTWEEKINDEGNFGHFPTYTAFGMPNFDGYTVQGPSGSLSAPALPSGHLGLESLFDYKTPPGTHNTQTTTPNTKRRREFPARSKMLPDPPTISDIARLRCPSPSLTAIQQEVEDLKRLYVLMQFNSLAPC
ncbi:hypothetical protein Tdes44962_MAKER03029 [Teratosphaeria destructans]|uniref:Uncharacterized protein n=1 Tax=Teratosphaeria destructans TaxID=418781 RepID=A0A9W7SRD7_9PEZI|nr:hypothetical protein Tdes44962_MAKER03029 [Teratosphaeria destructans]